jgi:tRNA pseudouridine38-40 synthase
VSEHPPTGYRLTLRYDGRAYYGWQRHEGKPTLQGSFEAAIEAVVGERCALHASGRTDRGAHADGQVAHFQASTQLTPDQLRDAIASRLPDDVGVLACELVPLEFRAREHAIAKTYRYEILNARTCPAASEGRVWHIPGALNVEAMRTACPVLVGQHDFASFATKTNYLRASTTRHVMSIELTHAQPRIVVRMRADGFLYKMVRNLVRAIVKVGEGRGTPAQLAEILAAKDRKLAPGTAPASGLVLESVEYPD